MKLGRGRHARIRLQELLRNMPFACGWSHLMCVWRHSPPPPFLRHAYSQCASTTSRGALSSGKLTARRAREAVSSSSSSLSRSGARWPMAAHRRHFLFPTGGDCYLETHAPKNMPFVTLQEIYSIWPPAAGHATEQKKVLLWRI